MSLLDKLSANKPSGGGGAPQSQPESQKSNVLNIETASPSPAHDIYSDAKRRIHVNILEEMNRSGQSVIDREKIYKKIEEHVNEDENMIPRIDRPKVVTELFHDIMGYGPIEEILESSAFSEVMVNGPKQVYCESQGKLTLTDVKFRDNAHVLAIATRIVTAIGRRIDESSPLCDATI